MSESESQSVTSEPCRCGTLTRQANDSDCPIIFDETLNKYHFQWSFCGREARMPILHCPWCGGVASDSHRASLFHELKPESCEEIVRKTEACATLNEVIAVLGPPDEEEFTALRFRERAATPPRVDRIPRIIYHSLSAEMSVAAEQQIGGSIALSFIPKPLGPVTS